jgi:hypothetical protein
MVVSRRNLIIKRGHHLGDPGIETVDAVGEMVDVGQVHGDHQGVVVVEASQQGPAQLGDPGAHPGQRHVRQDVGVAFAVDQRSQHPP